MRTGIRTFAIFILLAAGLRAGAQTCTVDQTIKECFETLTGHAASTQVGDEVKAMVATTNTGKPDLSTISNSTLRDFLSLFTAEFGTSAVSQKNGAFTVDYNVPVNVLHAGDVVKLQGIFAKPELDSGLKTALGTNAAAISTLDSFDEGDDITASATYSPQTARFGRQLAMNSNVFDALAWGRIAPFPQRDAPHEDGLVLLARAADKLAGAPEDVKKSHAKFSSMGDKAPEALAAFEAAILAMMADRQAEKALLTSFAELVNNQEQIYFSATYHDRNSLAGANAFSIKGTWEMGGKNLSKFLAQNRADCDLRDLDNEVHALEKPAPKSQACFTRFEEYVKSADRGLRFAFALDVQRTEANAIVLPQYSVNLSTERADTQIISASVGKRLDPPTSSHERRIDFTGSYENVDKDPNRDDRLVASVTYTQELTNTFSLPITLTFANKEKFLTAKDGNRVSAHFAISYKLPKM